MKIMTITKLGLQELYILTKTHLQQAICIANDIWGSKYI